MEKIRIISYMLHNTVYKLGMQFANIQIQIQI